MEAGGPFNHDNTITITFKRDDCRSVAGGPMIWLAERIAVLVVIIIGSQILFNPLRG